MAPDPSPETVPEDLLYECLERVATEGPHALDCLCREHPKHAESLRRAMAQLADADLVDRSALSGDTAFPETLGDYRLLQRIGGGGMGIVYLAEQVSLGRRVALKVMRPDRAVDPRNVVRFRREVEAIAQLRHPSIVSVISVGYDREIPYIAMEWLEGATLHEVLRCFDGRRAESLSGDDLYHALRDLASRRTDRALESSEAAPATTPDLFRGSWCDVALRIAREIASALVYAHAQGVIHRDVKPSNIWITPQGRVVLIDFGLARASDASRLTNTGAQLGSLLYMSPEQLSGASVDERTDVYALGVTLYETLAFRSPFEAASSQITMRRIVAGEVPSLRHGNRSISRDVQTICSTAMSRHATRRYPDAAALGRDLSNVLERRSIEARPPGRLERAWRWIELHPARSVAGLLLATLVTFILVTAAQQRSSLQSIRLLADSHWIEKLTGRSDAFWPMDPANLDAIDLWLEDVATLRERHDIHRRELDALRRRALPYTDEIAARDRAPTEHTLAALRIELDTVHSLVANAEDAEAARAYNALEIEALGALIAELETKDTRTTWEFASRSDEWRHERLTRLVEEDYRDLLALEHKVRDQRKKIEDVHRLTHIEHAEDWRRAIDDIASLDIYRGLHITPQIGLRPLRRNPQSGLWEFLHVPSGVAPTPSPTEADPGRLEIEADTGIVLVLLPGGTSSIGTSDGPADLNIPIAAEKPRHEVTLDPFFISKYELTVGQYRRLEGPDDDLRGEGALPAGRSRVDVVATFERTWLELPTEAQWEYACRAGTDTLFYTGNTVESLIGHANLYFHSGLDLGDSDATASLVLDTYKPQAPVGMYLPNPFGLHDMHGNAKEWVADVLVNRAYTTMEARPGDGLRYFARHWLSGLRYVVRGGDNTSHPTHARSAYRTGFVSQIRWKRPGVRPARPLFL